MNTVKITIRGRNGQIVFFDDQDRGMFRWACSLLPSHLSNDLRTYERCGKATKFTFYTDRVEIEAEPWDWSSEEIARFLCQVYDSYFRRKYKRDGKQTIYEIK